MNGDSVELDLRTGPECPHCGCAAEAVAERPKRRAPQGNIPGLSADCMTADEWFGHSGKIQCDCCDRWFSPANVEKSKTEGKAGK